MDYPSGDHQAGDYRPGHMDVAQQTATYRTFNGLLHLGSLILATGLSFFVLWLCAHAGFLPSLIVAIVVAAVGSWMISRPKGH